MAHFARLDENNKVISVEAVANEVITDADGNEQEHLGIDFLTNLYGGGWYKQTSYNDSIKKKFAGINYTYDAKKDAFIQPKPYPSWVLNEDTYDFDPPIPYPNNGTPHAWDEDTTSWVEVTGE